MKEIACGDVAPGCREISTAPSEGEVLVAVGAHARDDHGLAEVPPALVEQVRSRILALA